MPEDQIAPSPAPHNHDFSRDTQIARNFKKIGPSELAKGYAWLMLAYPEDMSGNHFALRAFAPAKSGKSWWRLLPNRNAAIQAKRELVAAGIRFKCHKVPKQETLKPAPPIPTKKRAAEERRQATRSLNTAQQKYAADIIARFGHDPARLRTTQAP